MYNILITPKGGNSFYLDESHRIGISFSKSLASGTPSPQSTININECQITCLYSAELNSLRLEEGAGIKIANNEGNIFSGSITSIKNRVSSDSNNVVLLCEDCLKGLLDKTIPTVKIEKGITFGSYVGVIFKALGVTNFYIESSISATNIDYAFAIGSKVGEFLNELCIAYNLYIYVDSSGVINIISKQITGSIKEIINGDNYVLRTSIGSSLSNSYSVVKVGYTHNSIKESELVLEIKDIKINSGLNTLNKYSLSNKNLYAVNYIKVISSSEEIVVSSYEASQTDISLGVLNKGVTPVTCTIQVYGYTLGVAESFIERENSVALGKIGRKEFTINSKLIQSETHANTIANLYNAEMGLSVPYIECDVINVDKFDLGDTIRLDSTKLGIYKVGYVYSIKGYLALNSLCKGSLIIKVVTN